MKNHRSKRRLFVTHGGELALSGRSLIELLRAVLDKRKPFKFRAKGFSMSPFVRDGDVITVSPFSSVTLRIGEIVAYISPRSESLVVHRVVGRTGNSYLIKGDNRALADEVVPEANILGCVTKAYRKGKKISLGLGPERRLIAYFSRICLLPMILAPARRFYRLFHPRTLST